MVVGVVSVVFLVVEWVGVGVGVGLVGGLVVGGGVGVSGLGEGGVS